MRVIGWETRSRNEGESGIDGRAQALRQIRAAKILVRPRAYL